MENEMKKRVAEFLRSRGYHPEAEYILKRMNTHVEFGPCVQVYVEDKFGGTSFEIGINWSALGTRDVKTTTSMVRKLTEAVWFAEDLQEVIEQS